MKVRALRAGAYRPGFSASLLLVTAAYLTMGLAAAIAWRFTGDESWIHGYFTIPAALLAAFLAGSQFWFSLEVLRRFEPDEAMHPVWLCISGSAAFNAAGVLLSQILSESPINPLAGSSPSLYRFGHLLGGTGRFALLSLALWMVLGIYRRSGLLARLKLVDWFLCVVMTAYVLGDLLDMAVASKHRTVPIAEIISWLTDPLLLILLVVCIRLYRSNQRMGPGAIGRCWNALAVGVALVCIGVGSLWASRWGYLPWPYSSLFWYLWLPADAAFALAPFYQLEAMQQATLPLQAGRVDS